ncbi:hypothetical protein CV_1961 [Chromobacterium violaceum ATCC 12472]|uniref:Uncharacterized protein n=1 Tax=Chromobacterium violaceum (strain ATCC 12472 / DSM 30191 / JCM 1249 / CCUG 213 / NBRC 12614 / NCIMB 9131 / NCTC 9757 / MK) TaxID=243365 RepID=Q7NWM2_CHRVO|nr:hypothetical protein CV_1961 [Chromobacterium violaceum ATCC 12472]
MIAPRNAAKTKNYVFASEKKYVFDCMRLSPSGQCLIPSLKAGIAVHLIPRGITACFCRQRPGMI